MVRLLQNGMVDAQFRMSEDMPAYYGLWDVLLMPDQSLLTGWAYDGLRLVNGDPRPRVSVREMSGGGLAISTPSIIGDLYSLERSTDFKTWISLETKPSSECFVEFHVPSIVPPSFYRVLRQPVP